MDNNTRQQSIIEAMSQGRFLHTGGKPIQIRTAISNVFVCDDKVYKVYKDNNTDFNCTIYDLSNRQNRFDFIQEDFSCNHNLNPEVYLELAGIVRHGDSLLFTSPTQSCDDWVIIMKKIDTSDGLTKKLLDKSLSPSDFYQIGYQLAKDLTRLSSPSLVGVSMYQDLKTRVQDIANWIAQVEDRVSSQEASMCIQHLTRFVEDRRVVFEHGALTMGACTDIHAENAFYHNGTLLLIDTYLPKEVWRRGYTHLSVYRLATDAYALHGEEAFRDILRGYEAGTGNKLDTQYEDFFVLYATSIMCPYFYMLGSHDLLRMHAAEKYHVFLREKIATFSL